MKKRLCALFLVCALTAALAAPAFAEGPSPYGLYVAGTPVTADNAADVLGNGKVKYDPATNTLTLTGAEIAVTEEIPAISYQGTDTLTVHGVGSGNRITAQGSNAMSSYMADLRLTGTLDLVQSDTNAIGIIEGDLSVEGTVERLISTVGAAVLNWEGDVTVSGTVGTLTAETGAIVALQGNIQVSGTIAQLQTKNFGFAVAEIPTEHGVEISGTVEQMTVSASEEEMAFGIWCHGQVTLSGDLNMTAAGEYPVYFLATGTEPVLRAEILTEGVRVIKNEDNPAPLWYFGMADGTLPQSIQLRGNRTATVAIPMYWPTVNQVAGGSVKASPLAGSEGATMNLLVKTAEGRVLEELIVTDAEGQRIPVEQTGEGRYSFIQPASKVTVTPVFAHADPLEGFAKTDPAAPATRGDLAELLWRLEGKPVVNYLMQFSDVQDSEAIRWAASQGLMQGHGDGTFRPEEAITRQEAATVLYRWTQSKGGGFTGMWMFLLQHPDRADVAEWAYEAVCWVTMHEILDCPEGMIRPGDTISRAELAEMVNRMEG